MGLAKQSGKLRDKDPSLNNRSLSRRRQQSFGGVLNAAVTANDRRKEIASVRGESTAFVTAKSIADYFTDHLRKPVSGRCRPLTGTWRWVGAEGGLRRSRTPRRGGIVNAVRRGGGGCERGGQRPFT